MNTNPEQSCNGLAAHIEALRLPEICVSSGREWLNESESLPPGIERGQVRLTFRSVSVCLKHGTVPTPYIEASCDILADEKIIGVYRLVTDLSGKPDDDYWIIH
jgi:hypothetical protein